MPTTDDITPYCGFIISEARREYSIGRALCDVKAAIRLSEKIEVLAYDSDWAGDGGKFITLFFKQNSPPHWARDSDLSNTTYEYVSIGHTNGYFIFHSSNSDIKNSVLDLISKSGGALNLIARDVLNYAFVQAVDLRSLWLQGIHKKTSVKADSKALTGNNLRFALDPSADQSYSYNSLRATMEIDRADKVFGINLVESYIWLYRLSTWKQFLSNCDQITTILKNSRGKSCPSPVDTLSHPISDATLMKGAYDFAIIDPDGFELNQLGQNRLNLLQKIKKEYECEMLNVISADNSLEFSVHHVDGAGLKFFIGNLKVVPEIKKGSLALDVNSSAVSRGRKGQLDDFSRIFKHVILIRVWYESGHVITGGACYEMSYRIDPFKNFYWATFTGFDIEKEKPLAVPGVHFLSRIGIPGEDSLFSWIFAAISRGVRANVVSHLKLSSPKDFLLCDDGAGEMADFIHATTINGHHHLTFIHAKAADTKSANRKISVGAHDIVINQAVKNIGLLDKHNLYKSMSSRFSANNSKSIWNCVVGVVSASTTQALLDEVNIWQPGRIIYHVVIVQPHTLRKFYRKNSSSAQRDQLNTLLNNAAHAINGLGGTLTVVASRI